LIVPDPLALDGRPIAVPAFTQPEATPSGRQPTRRDCNRTRRAWIGALIGAAAAIPLAKVAYDRFENEAANGTSAAAAMIGLGAGAGAFIGLSTCQ
jgi:hypothetical protein